MKASEEDLKELLRPSDNGHIRLVGKVMAFLRCIVRQLKAVCLPICNIETVFVMHGITYKPIGIIHSPLKEPRDAPIQSALATDVEGTVDIFPEYAEGLADLKGFSHIILIYHFHLSKGVSLKVKPYLDEQLRGVFATRAPARPNPIGMSIVRLVRVEAEKLSIQDVDILDGAPLLDIKPYVPEFDSRNTDKIGWLSGKIDELPEAR